MPRLQLKCKDCQNSFNLSYLFFRPEHIKCPQCSSFKVQEEVNQNAGCGCGNSKEKPFRFT